MGVNNEKLMGTIIATKNQLLTIGADEIPNGALVEVYEIDKFITIHGAASKVLNKYDHFDYIIPTNWILLNK